MACPGARRGDLHSWRLGELRRVELENLLVLFGSLGLPGGFASDGSPKRTDMIGQLDCMWPENKQDGLQIFADGRDDSVPNCFLEFVLNSADSVRCLRKPKQ